MTAQETVVLPYLALLLDEPLVLRYRGPDTTRPSGSPGTIRNTTGVEPDDDPVACRWAALRNQAHGLDIVATVIRQDGRWARLHNDAYFARSACADSPTTRASTSCGDRGRLSPISSRAKSRILRILSP
ncbi:hypothetical protein [Streptomyces europaeiscabiei]|uniref:hypothetical protein n=1 Tax=Streptomyces europaeiscabiei TaxID=146819 RepID=UPI0029BA500D|nr:hypothetical protein [Streptomyces europaeiscabiei]MDX3775989.1 hypothetical protein [Streptomyces europaeiscabiei]